MPTLVSSFFLPVLVTSPPAAPCCSHRGSSSLQHERPEHSCLWPAPVTSLWILQPESFLEAQPPVPVQRPVLGGGAEVHPRRPLPPVPLQPLVPKVTIPREAAAKSLQSNSLTAHQAPLAWDFPDKNTWWVVISSCKGSSQRRGQTCISLCLLHCQAGSFH